MKFPAFVSIQACCGREWNGILLAPKLGPLVFLSGPGRVGVAAQAGGYVPRIIRD